MKSKQHKCDAMHIFTGANCINLSIGEIDQRWFLVYESFALEQDVRAGEASSVGDRISSTSIAINFCPFCGKKLIIYFIK